MSNIYEVSFFLLHREHTVYNKKLIMFETVMRTL